MTAYPTLRDIALRIAPRWLRGPNASRVLYAPGLVNDADAVVQAAGLRAGLPGLCDEDSLLYLGRDRKLTRGPSEPADLFAARLTASNQSHQLRGGNYELLRQIWHWWSPNFRTVTLVQNNSIWYQIDPSGNITRTDKSATPNWKWDASFGGAGAGPTPKWWRFWIIVSGAPFFKWRLGDGHRIGDPNLVLGTTAPSWWVEGLRGIVRTWKAADAICDRIILKYDDTLFLPTNPAGAGMPDGTWDKSQNRVSTATYLNGVT